MVSYECHLLCNFASKLGVSCSPKNIIVKLTKLFQSLSLCFCLSLCLPQTLAAQKKAERTEKYTVQPGETILGIAHRHGTTLDHLLSLNPGVKADYIQVGQVLTVPYVPGGAEPAPTPEQRAAAAAKNSTTKPVTATAAPAASSVQPSAPVAPPSKVTQKAVGQTAQPQPKVTYKEYKVKKKDTPYSLAKANNITVDELMAANPELKADDYKLKKGMTIKIPVKVSAPKPKFNGLKTIRVAVVLPLLGNGVENVRSVEFYRGMLMGIERLKENGVNVTVNVYNEPAPSESVAQTVTQLMAQSPDVVVGPLYPTHFTDLASISSKQTKVVVPFSSKVPQVDYRPEVFVVNTPATYEKSLSLDLFVNNFKKQTHVVMLHGSNGDRKTFSQELQSRLSAAGYDIVSLPSTATAEQISATLLGKKQGDYILVPDDGSESTMKQMLDKTIALQGLMPNANISLLGYDTWLPYAEGTYRTKIHNANTYILSSSYYYPYTTAAKAFGEEYKKWFKADMVNCSPKMAPLGYDLARGFLGGLATYGHDFNTQSPQENTVAAEPKLQSDARFITVGANGGYVSRSMWLVHFKKDLSIVKISAQ